MRAEEPETSTPAPQATPSTKELLLTLRLAGIFLTALAIVKETLRAISDTQATTPGGTGQLSHDLAETMGHLHRAGAISESVFRTVALADQYSEGLAYDLGKLLIGPPDQLRAELTQLINSLDSVVGELDDAHRRRAPLKLERLDDSGRGPRALLRMLTDQTNQALAEKT